MSDKIREIICAVLDELKDIAKKTKSPVDDFIVRMLEAIFECKK